MPLGLAFDELRGPERLGVGGIGLVSAGCCIVVVEKGARRG